MVNLEGIIDYSRQRSFDETFAQRTHMMNKRAINIVVGCGGVGFWLGIVLAMQGSANFILVDGDSIEQSNLNRLPVPPAWVGTNKAVALRKVMRTLRPMSCVSVIPKHFNHEQPSTFTKIISTHAHSYGVMIWDCTDDVNAQKALFKLCGEHSKSYRKLGYEGFQVGSYRDYSLWSAGDGQRGYRTSNACAATSALSAVIGFMSEGLNIERDVDINIADLLQGVDNNEELNEQSAASDNEAEPEAF